MISCGSRQDSAHYLGERPSASTSMRGEAPSRRWKPSSHLHLGGSSEWLGHHAADRHRRGVVVRLPISLGRPKRSAGRPSHGVAVSAQDLDDREILAALHGRVAGKVGLVGMVRERGISGFRRRNRGVGLAAALSSVGDPINIGLMPRRQATPPLDRVWRGGDCRSAGWQIRAIRHRSACRSTMPARRARRLAWGGWPGHSGRASPCAPARSGKNSS